MKFAAIFSILVGVGMIAQWTMSYLSHQIPELKTEPIRIGFHLAAEMATALCLIVSGTALLLGANWAVSCFLVAAGMLFYTSIVSPGYFAQQGQWGWLAMFSAIIILMIISLTLVL
ncbi:MAG: hypothetical protein ACK2TT_10430 [Anaerolineales bacterium]|jgi:hypothetical protein